jgi:serine phosphatase RsbU (regulator of sigma subunit)
LPTVPGYSFDAYYKAGREEAAIGGDWFDAIVAPGGDLVVSVGDVSGSGLEAAVLMGNLRQVLRAAAHVHTDPTLMLEVADRTLRSEQGSSIVTAFVGVIDPLARTMTYASAGHAPAFLRLPDGGLTELRAPGLPLGCRNLAGGENRIVTLTSGACLLLYTDGLVEWSRDYLHGEAVLRERFAGLPLERNLASARALVESVVPATGPRDDVAVLLVRIE